MRSRALDLLRSLAELVLDGKCYGVLAYPSNEIREELNAVKKDYKELIEKALGLKVFKVDWTNYESVINGECLKVIIGERRGYVESVSLSLAPLESCSPKHLASLLKTQVFVKEVVKA